MKAPRINFALLGAPALPQNEDDRQPLVEIDPKARAGKPPCGECHLQPGETCDICGAKEGEQP